MSYRESRSAAAALGWDLFVTGGSGDAAPPALAVVAAAVVGEVLVRQPGPADCRRSRARKEVTLDSISLAEQLKASGRRNTIKS